LVQGQNFETNFGAKFGRVKGILGAKFGVMKASRSQISEHHIFDTTKVEQCTVFLREKSIKVKQKPGVTRSGFLFLLHFLRKSVCK
jgi:hypothetical protein